MTNPSEQLLLIPQRLAQEVVDYLKKQPFEAVHGIMAQLLRLQTAQIVQPAAPAKEET